MRTGPGFDSPQLQAIIVVASTWRWLGNANTAKKIIKEGFKSVKIGIRKPSIKKSIKARTTGKIKRKIKKAIIPFYGQKDIGFIKNPKKAN